MANYSGKEKASLSNIKEFFQYLHGGGAQALRNALGLGDTLGVLPVINGGTGRNDFQIVDAVTNQKSADGVAISPAGVKSYFESISKNAISGSFTNGTLSLASTNENFTQNGNELIIKKAGTYDINVTANIVVRSSSGEAGDIFTCGYTVGGANYPVASITINRRHGSGSTNGNNVKSVYCSAGTWLGYYEDNIIGGVGSASVDYTMTLSFSIKQVVN